MFYIQTTTKYIAVMNTQFTGIDWFIAGIAFTDCASICALTSGCIAFTTFNDIGSGCWFKNATINGSFSGKRDTFIKIGAVARTYLTINQFAGTQAPMFNLSNGAGDCASLCDNTLNCVAYLIDSNQPRNCILQSNFTTYSPVAASSVGSSVMYYINSFNLVATNINTFIAMAGMNNLDNSLSSATIPFNQCPSTCLATVNNQIHMLLLIKRVDVSDTLPI